MFVALQLAEPIAQSVPFKDKHKHPATRSFQAIRIYINAELDELESVLNFCIRYVGTRRAFIDYQFPFTLRIEW